MTTRRSNRTGFALALAVAGMASLAVAPRATAFVAGGGPARTDCFAAWKVTTDGTTANHGPTGVDCQDGDPACDIDGKADGVCTIAVSACAGAMDVAGCTPDAVTAMTLTPRTTRLGLVPPAVPANEGTCGPATVVPVPLRKAPHGFRPSRPVVLALTATTASGRDRDVLRLRCVPNTGAGQCPANPSGGPRELRMAVAATGSDLDNGVTGQAHNFPLPAGSTLRMCVAGCDASTSSACVEDDAATASVQAPTFGPPLPLFTAGVATCIVNRFAPSGLSGGTADLATGVVGGDLHLLSDVYLTSDAQVCPTCSANVVGGTGTCTSGRSAGQACRTESITEAGTASSTRHLAVSSDCMPDGTPAGTLTLTLPLTTSTATLPGPHACGAKQDDGCGAGTCDAACTGTACVATAPDGTCIDVKGGLSQVCCSSNTALPCFPTRSGAIVRNGAPGVPTPAWPDTTYPKTGEATLVSTFCEGATGSIVVDAVTGLPGPGALVLPVAQTWMP
jgi:hypothetical protein